ncbi:MAG: SpoIID/LytB domain-containing protein [Phycisphaeraceae bacterium]|nr:MAG: SpoIID/LytB domain-containing protein [Phycisphaeraceae bacterium]
MPIDGPTPERWRLPTPLSLRRRRRRWRRRRLGATTALSCCLAGLLTIGFTQSCRHSTSSRPVWTPQASPLPEASDELRVRIRQRAERVRFSGPDELIVTPLSRRSAVQTLRGPLEIALSDDVYLVRAGGGVTRTLHGAGPLRIEAVGAAPIELDGAPYPGRFELHPTPRISPGHFDVIERVSLETYLPGVIARELYAGWSPTTFAAQAVAARTYALHERERRARVGAHFDLESDERDQVYGGLSANPRAEEAVRRTRGMVLRHEGRILRAYYSSTCGGRPGAAADTWPTGPGFEFNLDAPIQAHPRPCPCDFSPVHRWTVSRDRSELVDRFRAYGTSSGLAIRAIESLGRIEAVRTNAADRPAAYRVYDREGRWWPLSSEQLRLACNHNGVSGVGPVTPDSRVRSGDLVAEIEGGVVRLQGRGFGHGVGMCQFGAEGMARAGAKWEEILAHFYPGAVLSRVD